jgi:hypothetical protein
MDKELVVLRTAKRIICWIGALVAASLSCVLLIAFARWLVPGILEVIGMQWLAISLPVFAAVFILVHRGLTRLLSGTGPEEK